MGKKIDIFLVSVFLTAAAYFCLYGRLHNRLIAFILALFIFCILNRLVRKAFNNIRSSGWMQKRTMRKKADQLLLRFACMDADEAAAIAGGLFSQYYHEDCSIALLQQHPSTGISENSIFEQWKAHRGEDKLIICSTGRSEPAARMFAQQFQKPRIALTDADILSELFAEHPDILGSEQCTAVERGHMRLRRIHFALIRRKNAPRTILLALCMILMYLLSSGKLYLIAALLLIFISVLSLRRKSRPSKLF